MNKNDRLAKQLMGFDPHLWLQDVLACDDECGGNFRKSPCWGYEWWIEYLAKMLPATKYILDQMQNYIFSDGLTTEGNESEEARLESFLYSKNIEGNLNIDVLKDAVVDSILYGKSGIRWLSEKDGIINVKSKNYACIVDDNEVYFGFKDTLGYIVSMEDYKVYEQDYSKINWDKSEIERSGRIVDKTAGIVLLSPDELCNLRLDTSERNGTTPFEYDRQRVSLLLEALRKLNFDIAYDGCGRVVIHPSTSNNAEVSAADEIPGVGGYNKEAREKEIKRQREEVQKVLEEFKGADGTQVIYLSKAFDKEITHLPRVTKSTEFLDFVDQGGEIMAQVLGIDPTLVGFGNIAGNVSMESVIDNAIVNFIMPKREKFFTQISSFLRDKIGVSKIIAKSYNMKQSINDIDKISKLVNALYMAYRSDDAELANSISEMITNIVKDDNGTVKRLSTEEKDKRKQFIAETLEKRYGGNEHE